jgi:hypothetical protein
MTTTGSAFMTTKTTAAGTGEAAVNASSGNAGPSSKDCRDEAIRQVMRKLQAAIDTANDGDAQSLLHECINLISDACVMDHGFGAVLRNKSKSR